MSVAVEGTYRTVMDAQSIAKVGRLNAVAGSAKMIVI